MKSTSDSEFNQKISNNPTEIRNIEKEHNFNDIMAFYGWSETSKLTTIKRHLNEDVTFIFK